MTLHAIGRFPSRVVPRHPKAERIDVIIGPDGKTVLSIVATPEAVNAIAIANSAAGTGPTIFPVGEANADLNLEGAGTGGVTVDLSPILTDARIHSVSSKATPVDTDELPILDSAASNALKRLTIANLKALIYAYIVGAAPATMDTIDEIATALGDDPNFATTITNLLATKASLTGAETLLLKTLTGPRINQILDTNGNPILLFSPAASAVNYIQLLNAASGGTPSFSAVGGSTNIGIMFVPKGNGVFSIFVGAGQTPTIAAAGADTNLPLNLTSKGTSPVQANGVAVLTRTIATVTTTLTGGAVAGRDYVYFLSAGAAFTLPTAVGNTNQYIIKNIDSGAHNIATTSSQTIDGTAAPLGIAVNEAVTLISDGANWRIV